MPGLDQHKPVDNVQQQQQPGHAVQSTLHDTWGPNAVTKLSETQHNTNASDALAGFGQFCIGFGDGLSHFAGESVEAVGKAVSNPGAAIHNGVDGVKTAVGATCEATVSGTAYIANKVSHGDVAGMANDAVHTGQAIGKVVAQSADHFNHLSAKEKGYVFGHDVAPTVVGTIIAPELIPEGAAAAAFGKVASIAGAFIKEESIATKVVTTFEGAREKIASISEKMATLNHKMENLLHKEKSIVHTAMEDTNGLRLREGTIAHGLKPSESFKAKVAEVSLTPGEQEFLELYKVPVEPVHNMGAALAEDHVFALGAYKDQENVIRIAEHTGYLEDLLPNGDIAHTVHHEIGHSVNYWLGDRTMRPFQYVSDRADFASQFEADLAKDTNAASTARARLETLYPGDVRAQRDEGFSMMFGHVSCPSNVGYGKEMREALDGYYKMVEAFRKGTGI